MPWDSPAAPADQPFVDDEPPIDAYGAVDEAPAAAPFSPAPQPQPAAAPVPAPQPATAAPAPAEAPVPVTPPADLSPQFADIAAMLGEVFNQPLNVSVEPAASAGDQDSAADLAYDDQGADAADDFDPDSFNGEDQDDE